MLSHQLSAAQLQLVEAQGTIKMLEAPKMPIQEEVVNKPWWKVW
jgi:hypothetical protein